MDVLRDEKLREGMKTTFLRARNQAQDLASDLRRDPKRLRRVLMLGVPALVVFIAFFVWLFGGRYVSTDDAYVQASKLMVSTDVSGIVQDVDVKEGQIVRKGDVLFRLDPRPFQIALQNVQAQLEQTALNVAAMKEDYQRMLRDIDAQQAQVNLAQVTFERQAALLKNNATSKQNYDQANTALEAAKSSFDALKQQAAVQLAKLGGNADIPVEQHPLYLQAKAAVDEAKRQLGHTVVRAPFEGIVTAVASLQPGAVIISSIAAFMPTSAVGLVSTSNVWVEADFKETDLTWVKPGDPVDIKLDTYPGRTWHGEVASIAPATGSEFSVLPAQNSSGNWVKVTQRITVHVKLDLEPGDPPLRAGMSADVDIDTGHQRWSFEHY